MRMLTGNLTWVFLAAAVVTGGSAADARADDEVIAARVPFAFFVHDALMPAGAYVVKESSSDPGVVTIASADGRQSVFALTIPAAANELGAQPELVFVKIDNQYFLSRLVEADGNEREIMSPPAKSEYQRKSAATNP
jgi:hypothetical protein